MDENNTQNNETQVNETPIAEPTPVYQAPVTQEPKNSFAIAALVCGILGIVGAWIPVVNYFTLVLAILGIVFGVKGMKIAKQTGTGKGLAVAGLVCGIVSTAFAVIAVLCAICVMATAGAAINSVDWSALS